MTHELESILKAYQINKNDGVQSVLATVVDLDGSSYRKPGVRMLIDAHQKTVGAVSGGCVEKDIVFQAQKVFESGEALIMTYDGRYRLGCEGVLYILIEPLELAEEQLSLILTQIKKRKPLEIKSSYRREVGT
ncbi:MAG: XdhC family protein, partial [Flavobacteriaceae bacterium]